MNLPALSGELEWIGKLKFRRKYNNKPGLSIFPLLLLPMSEASLSHTTPKRAHYDHWASGSVSRLIDWLLLLLPILTPLSAPTRGNNSIAVSGFCFVCNCSCKIMNWFLFFMKFEIMYKVLLKYLNIYSLLFFFFHLVALWVKLGASRSVSLPFAGFWWEFPWAYLVYHANEKFYEKFSSSHKKSLEKNKEHSPLLE